MPTEYRNPQTIRWCLLLAVVQLFLGCRSSEEKLFHAAREAAGDEDFVRAIRLYREVTISFPDSAMAPQAHYELAQIYYLRNRDIEGAFTNLTKILTDYPESEIAWSSRQLLARLYEEDYGELESALIHYRRLLKRS